MTEVIFNKAMMVRKRFHTSDPFDLLDGMGVILMFSDAYPRDLNATFLKSSGWRG